MDIERGKRLAGVIQQLVFVGPATMFFVLIVIVPFILSIYYGFTDWNGVTSNISWVGFDNYLHVFLKDDGFRESFWFTTRYSVAAVVITNIVGFALALLLTQALKTSNFLRTIFFLPNVIGGLLLGFIWSFIFVRGFTAVGDMTGIPFFQLQWLGTSATAFWGIVIVTVWQYSGYLMVIYIAAILNVPNEIMEAAKMDGASRFQLLRGIIIPLIMPAVTVCLFLTISWSFKVFDLNLSLTNGGPFGSSESVALNIYKEAFRNDRFGLGTAKALIFFIIVAIITLIQVAITKQREVES